MERQSGIQKIPMESTKKKQKKTLLFNFFVKAMALWISSSIFRKILLQSLEVNVKSSTNLVLSTPG